MTSTSKSILEKKRKRVSKDNPKKTKKTKRYIIEVGKFKDQEEETAKTKQRGFEVHHLIAILGKLIEVFAKTTNKQG